MQICLMTTWGSKCGIAQYSQNLVKEFSELGHKVLILANYGEDSLQVNIPNVTVVKGLWGVNWWGENPSFSVNDAELKWALFEQTYGPIDVFHVQYQGSLYEPEGFNAMEKTVKCKKVITFHDSSRHPRHNFDSFVSIAHNQKINADNYLPFPTIERTPVVFSFGMGRNDYAFIEAACKEIGVDFEGHDARKDGWLSEDILFEKMNNADAIVLWYNDVPIHGQSAALRTAISSMRPVIANHIPWFSDAPDFVYTCKSKATLQAILKDVLHLDYIRERSFKVLAKQHMEIYNGR